MMDLSVLVFIIIGVAGIYIVYIYNRFITLKNRAMESLSDIDVQFKRRYDLIPNLLETVKGYASYEKEVFTEIAGLRSRAMQQKTEAKSEKVQIENQISQALKSVFAVAENYPELKANQNFLKLQNELTDTEDKLQAARRFYNTNVLAYNTTQQIFPNSIFAGLFRHQLMKFFEIEQAQEREVVPVK